MILMSPLFGVFSRGSLVKDTAATCGQVNQRAAERRACLGLHRPQERF